MDYEGDVESDLMCTFKIGYTDVFGSVLTHELKENGAEIPVTNENRLVCAGAVRASCLLYSVIQDCLNKLA